MLNDLRLRWLLWRNRTIGDPRVRDLARWLPLARRPARTYASGLFDLTAGFVYSQVTQALIESGLLQRLAFAPASLKTAAGIAKLSEDAADTLLKAGEPLELTEQVGKVWTVGRLGAALIASPGLAEMIRHHRLLYADLADPLAMLRREGPGRLTRLWRYDTSAEPAEIEAYSTLMAATQPMVAEQALAAYRFDRHRRLLDVGGGAGAFLEQVGRAAPALELGLFDRPSVVDQARLRLGERAAYLSGDFQADPLPAGYDAITLVRILHDHDDDPVSRLLGAVRTALMPGGRVIIVEPLAQTMGAQRMGHAYFGMYLAAVRSGRPRSWPEYKAMLVATGFRKAWRLRTPLPLVASVIVGQT